MSAAIHRATRHALPDDPLLGSKIAHAEKWLDKAAKAGEHRATCLQATREAREAGLCGKGPRLAPQERESTARALGQGGESNG